MFKESTQVLSVKIRFYEELNDFIRKDIRKRRVEKGLKHSTTVKDVIESFGVPHTEVDLILVNGESADFNYHVNDQDDISVYPMFESLNISGVTRLQGRPLRDPRFVVDVNLGRLAKKLRFLGLDTIYRNDYSDEDLLQIVTGQERVLLTRDRRLLMHKVVQRGYLPRSDIPNRQTVEVVHRFDLADQLKPFYRCMECNGVLNLIPKAEILHRLESKTKLYYQHFAQCGGCGKEYWQGSHYHRLRDFAEWVCASAKSLALE